MTNGLTTTQTKILTWAVYALLFLLTGAVSYVADKQANMASQYVRLERYQSDKASMQCTLDDIKTDTRDTRQLVEKIYLQRK